MGRNEELAARHAAKMRARLDDPSKCQTYPANRGAGLIAHIRDQEARYQAKLDARVAEFNAGRPSESVATKPAEDDMAALEAATKPESKPAKAR